ncbi:MAG: LysE family transporter [Acidimicrobiia bacterium]
MAAILLPMWDVIVGGLVAGYAIAIPVGAIAVLIVNTAMRCGFGCGASAGAGAATADLIYALVAATAGTAAARVLAPWENQIRLVSGLVLLGLAANGLIALRKKPDVAGEAFTVRRGELALTYGRFLGLTVINPMTVVYFGTVVLGAGVGRALSFAEAGLFAVAAFAASLSWQTLLAGIGALARKGLSPTFRTATTIVGNLFIVAVALRIMV